MEPRWFTQDIRYDPRLGYVMLQLPNLTLPSTIEVEGTEFEAKNELHCSLICIQKLAELFRDQEAANRELISFVEAYVQRNHIYFNGFTDNIYTCEYEEAKSIVIGARIEGVEELFAALRWKFAELKNFPPPALHITLYKYNHRYGIGIQNETQLREWCHLITLEMLPKEIREKL